MKVVFLGTPEFSVNVLNSIYNSSHEIVGVVTQPDRKVGRKGIITPCQVKVQAQNLNLPVFSFEKISAEGVELLKSLNADIFVTCAYGQILSQQILDISFLIIHCVEDKEIRPTSRKGYISSRYH